MVEFEIKKLEKDSKFPTRSYAEDAGWDIYSLKNHCIRPHSVKSINTGIAIKPSKGYYITVEGRSSMFRKNIFPIRGIIDANYTGELIVALSNHSDIDYWVEPGDRIAQIIVHKVHEIEFKEVEEFTIESGTRGANGFGSTGK